MLVVDLIWPRGGWPGLFMCVYIYIYILYIHNMYMYIYIYIYIYICVWGKAARSGASRSRPSSGGRCPAACRRHPIL